MCQPVPAWQNMKDATPVKNLTPVINVYTERPLCPRWPATNDVNTMNSKVAASMCVNFVAKAFSHPIVLKNTCLHIATLSAIRVIFVANNWKTTLVIEDIWSVFMDKNLLVRFATKISQLLMVLICINEKFMVFCTKEIYLIFMKHWFSSYTVRKRNDHPLEYVTLLE